MSQKILILGSSNTDMVVKVEHLPAPGETILGGEFTMGAGGKGANQAVAARRLGGDVTFICKVGKDLFGENAVKQYQKEGIDTSNILYSDKPSGVALIYVDHKAENCIAVASGANSDITVDEVRSLEGVIKSSSLLLLQLETPVDVVLEAAKIAYSAGVKVVLNPAPACELPKELYKYLSLIIPNQGESALLSGEDVYDEASAIEAAKALVDKGVESVVITMGSKGSMIYDNLFGTFVPARKVEAVDTTAAGDTFCAGVCVALAQGKPLAEAVAFGTAASSLTVQKMGAQDSIPTIDEVMQIL
jgi:ribokinase